MGLWSDQTDWTDGNSVGAYRFNRYVRDPLRHLFFDAHPQRVTLWHEESRVTAGAAIAKTVDAAAYFNYYARQTPSVDGDSFTQSAVLTAGVYYSFQFACFRTDASGMLDCYVDGAYLGTCDFYTGVGGGTYSFLTAVMAISPINTYLRVEESGRHLLTFTVNVKNAASTGYRINLSQIVLFPLPADGDY